MEILGKIGVDAKLLIAQVVNFVLLIWVLNRLLYRPLLDRIEKDEAELEQARRLQKELTDEKEAFSAASRRQMLETKEKARNIIREAEEIGDRIRQDIRQEVDLEKDKVLKQIRSRLDENEYGKSEE